MRKFIALLVVLVAVFLVAARAPDPLWKPLFNGKDLTGWKHVGPGHMTVENGLIQTHGGMGLLYWTGGKVGHSRIRVVYKMRDNNDNSGVFIRIPIEPREEWMPVHYGYEVQIDNHPETSNEDEYHVTGNALLPHQTPCQTWQTRPRVEYHAYHHRRPAHHRRT